jgi:PTH1 family peptidyl-tRNA hydrolase
MAHVIVGLGNTGEEYEGTRHNVGRMMVSRFTSENKFPEWEKNKKTKSLETNATVRKEKIIAVLPETMMNKSGEAVRSYSKSKKDLERLVVLYDDLDLPLGRFKISFGRNSGGHRGLESIIKNLKTKDFTRIRVGISPATPSGKLKKPSGEKAVVDFILGKFKPAELDILKKEGKKILEAIALIATEGRSKAMGEFN